MKYMLLTAVGLMLSVVSGCATFNEGSTPQTTKSVHALKENGCQALSSTSKRLLVLLIKSRIPEYPVNGICNPQWVNDVLLKQIDKLEKNETP